MKEFFKVAGPYAFALACSLVVGVAVTHDLDKGIRSKADAFYHNALAEKVRKLEEANDEIVDRHNQLTNILSYNHDIERIPRAILNDPVEYEKEKRRLKEKYKIND